MSPAERVGALVALLSWLLLAMPARAEVVDLERVFAASTKEVEPRPSAAEVLRRALDNWERFPGILGLEIERRASDGSIERTAFRLHRRQLRQARRILVASIEPQSIRGNRVLQLVYDDGRADTFAFTPGGEPIPAAYQLADPFLVRWRPVSGDERTSTRPGDLEYEIVGFARLNLRGETAYELLLRPNPSSEFVRTELVVATSDYALLELRQYTSRSAEPALVARVDRADIVEFTGRAVPTRILYEDRVQNASIDVQVRYERLPDDSAPLFYPSSFYRVPLP